MREHLSQGSFDAIRNFARSYGDDNPLWNDEEYGYSTRWGSQIAPPMIGVAMNKPLLSDKPEVALKKPSFRGIHVFVSGSTWEWFRPLRAGDTLSSFGGFESVNVKKSEFAERSVQIVHRNVKFNQRGEVVALTRMLAIYAERKTARDKGKYAAIEPANYTDEDLAKIDAIYAAEQPRGGETRYWEDVEVGDALRPMAKGPLTTTDIIVFHAGGYGFTPYAPTTGRLAYENRQRIKPFYVKNAQGIPDVAQRVHWDPAWAQAIGNPIAYDYGVLRDCWLSHALTDWMGDDGWLMRLNTEIRKFNYMGDTHVITGEVIAKRVEDGRHLVDIELRGTNQRDVVTCPGSATIALPSRTGGPVVLPEAPADLQQRSSEILARHGVLDAARRAALSQSRSSGSG